MVDVLLASLACNEKLEACWYPISRCDMLYLPTLGNECMTAAYLLVDLSLSLIPENSGQSQAIMTGIETTLNHHPQLGICH